MKKKHDQYTFFIYIQVLLSIKFLYIYLVGFINLIEKLYIFSYLVKFTFLL